jgi:multidrug efflux system membrane fusion protein
LTPDPFNTPSNADSGPRGFFAARPALWTGISVLAAAALILYLILRHPQTDSAQGPGGAGRGGQNGPVAVSVATAIKGDIAVRIPALGAITPLATVTVKTQISGQLQKIAFTEGQLVKAGDFLAQIDPRPYQATLSLAEANLRRDTALLANAKLDLARYEGLIKEDSIAEQQLATQKALVLQYAGTVEGDQAQVNTASLNLRYTHIVAPLSGRVGLRQVDQGNYVTAGDTNGIVVITQLQPISSIFSIPEDNITVVMKQLHSGAALPVAAFDRANSIKLADGKLQTADNEIDPSTGTIKLRAMFDNTEGLLFPNQFVNIQLLVSVSHDQVIIPNSAVHRGAPNGTAGSFVYLVNSDKTVSVRTVTLGTVDVDRVAVASGLSAGDIVVTEGGDRLRDGSSVILPTTTSPPGQGQPPGQVSSRADPSQR